jgi:hypothetical protein
MWVFVVLGDRGGFAKSIEVGSDYYGRQSANCPCPERMIPCGQARTKCVLLAIGNEDEV